MTETVSTIEHRIKKHSGLTNSQSVKDNTEF